MERTETIEIVPSWRAAVQIYIMCLEGGTEEGRASAREELLKMGELLDQLRKEQEEQNNEV